MSDIAFWSMFILFGLAVFVMTGITPGWENIKNIAGGVSRNKRYIDDIIKAIPNAAIIWDKKGCLVMANPAFLEIEQVNAKTNVFALLEVDSSDVVENEHFVQITTRMIEDKERLFEMHVSTFNDSANRVLYMAVVYDKTRRYDHESALAYVTSHDAVTKLPLRLSFEKWMTKEIQDIESGMPRRIAVFIIAVDQFRALNDAYGADNGNHTLQVMGDKIKTLAGKREWVARLEGNRFVVTKTVHSSEEAKAFGQIICETVGTGITLDNQRMDITCSAGVAIFPSDGSSAKELMQFGEMALRSQNNANNQDRKASVVMYEDRTTTPGQKEEMNKQRIKQALADNEFYLLYQPIRDLRSDSIWGYETLLRWKDSATLKTLTPVEIIPIAESVGLAKDVGQWSINAAIDAYKKSLKNKSGERIVVNVLSAQLQSVHFPDWLDDCLFNHDIDHSKVVIDITERISRDFTQLEISNVKKLSAAGIAIYIDEFGSANSSLNKLEQLKVSGIRIDKALCHGVSDLTEKQNNLGVLINVGENLNLDVFFDGVTTKEDAQYIHEVGARFVQGDFYGKPTTSICGSLSSSVVTLEARD